VIPVRLRLTDFMVTEAPLLARLLTLSSATGIANLLAGRGIQFETSTVAFRFAGGNLEITEAHASGSQLGLTVDGWIAADGGLDLRGTIVPLYDLNRALGQVPLIGTLLAGGGSDGVFAAPYWVKGTRDAPEIGVNPLAVLAPGLVRKLVQGIIAGGYDALVRAREGAEDHPEEGARDLEERGVRERDFVLGIATSGTTPYVHGALARARELGARTGLLLCTTPSEDLVRRHDVVIAPLVGPEVITGSTRMKAGTATKLVLNTLTTGAMVLTGKVWGNLMVDLKVTCEKLRDRAQRIIRVTLDLESDEAAEVLEGADGQVKTAIVMHRLGVDRDEARRLLDRAGGRVAGALEEPR
jgi:N-acetylmuramic acid 6-phosphate etherase